MGLADKATVEAMQLRIPALCSEDSKFLESLMSEGVLFPRLNNEQKLRHIWSNVLKVKCPIPTLFTFFEDIKWLMPLVKIMKRLLGKKFKGTVGKAMAQNFSGVNQSEEEVKVRETESTFRSYRGTLTDQVRLGVFQLWLFLARKFTDMISECPRKEEGQDKPVPKTPDIYVWHEFAVLAYNLGFECEEIHRLRSKNRDREIARAALLELEFFVDGSGENLKRRSGRTFVNAYAYDRQRLFLKAFLVPNRVGGKGITSLFVRVSVILAFFGELVLGSPKTPTTALSDILGQPVGPETEVFTLQQGGQMLTSSEKSEQETGLKEEVDRLRSELTRADEDRSKMREEMQKLVQQKADMEQTVGGLQTEASGLRNRVVDQEREVKQLRDDQVRARTEIDEYKDPTEKRIKALNMEIADLRREQESVQSNNQKLLDTCRKLEGELRKVEAAESQTSREYRRKIEELSTRNNELQQGFNRSQMTQSNALTDAENEKRKHLSEKEELQREVQQLRTKSHGLRQSLDKSAATQLAILNDYSTEKQKLLASKEKLQKDLDVSKTAHFDALEKTSTENKNLLDRSKVLLDEKEKLLVQINALQQELESCKTKLEEVSTEKKELSASHKQLLDENKKLLLKINEVELLAKHESKEEGLEAEADLLRNEKRGLEQRLADIGRLKTVWLARTEEVASLKAHLSQSLQDMEKMKKDADAELGIRLQIEKTNHTTQEQLNLKVLENQELQERVDSLVQRVASLEKEHQQVCLPSATIPRDLIDVD
jgi:predicted  nucleic acid-binding Zn-ribbon protein